MTSDDTMARGRTRSRFARFIAVTLAFWALLLSVPAFALGADMPSKVDDPAYTRAQQLVEVAPGRRLNLYCVGHGSPTVVFEAGLGDEAATWGRVQPAIGARTRACSYERAGLGFSDTANRAGTAANAVDDLHHLLAAAGIKPPYVLVGHSYGGMIVRLYADMYPSDVVGMVLIDSADEDWPATYWKIDPEQRSWEKIRDELFSDHTAAVAEGQKCVDAARAKTLTKDSPLYGQCVPAAFPAFGKGVAEAYAVVHESVAFQAASLSEGAHMYSESADQLRVARRWYGDMPLVVLVPAVPKLMPKNVPPDMTQRQWDAMTHATDAFHDRVAALSRKGEVRYVENTMHYVQLAQPEAVSRAVMDVVGAAGH